MSKSVSTKQKLQMLCNFLVLKCCVSFLHCNAPNLTCAQTSSSKTKISAKPTGIRSGGGDSGDSVLWTASLVGGKVDIFTSAHYFN